MASRVLHQLLRGGSVSGTVDATYDADWLIDGIPGTPVQRTGNLSLAVTPPGSIQIDTLVLVNHNVSVTAGISGSITASIAAGALQADGIRLNPYVRFSPATISTAFTLAVNSNPASPVIGELFGGLSVELPDFQLDHDPGPAFPWESEFASIPPYDAGLSEPRRWTGEVILTDAEFELIKTWYTTTRRGTRPSIFIPDDTVNDAWCVVFQYRERYAEGVHFVTLDLAELPRTRW